MTRLVSDGAENADVTFWEYNSGANVSTAYAKTGLYSYGIGPTTPCKYLPDLSELYVRVECYHPTMSAGGKFISLWHDRTVAEIMALAMDTNYKLTLYIGGNLVATGNRTWNFQTHHLVEIYFKMADSPNGICQIKLDGILEIDYSSQDTAPGTYTHIDGLRLHRFNEWAWSHYDDIAVNDTTGTEDNSWCGPGHYIILLPNANGDTNNWTGNDGNQTDNYLLVDDIPPDDDSTYVTASGTSKQDMYHLADFNSTNKIVTRIIPTMRAKETSASAGQIKFGYKTRGITYLSDAITLESTYKLIVGSGATISPASGIAWTDAELDAIQLVIENQ